MVGEAIRDLAVLRRLLERELVCNTSAASLAVLSTLERNGSRRVGEIAELMDVDLSVASRHTSALEAHGLVVREPASDDRRAHVISLTADGLTTLTQARRWVAERLDSALAAWPLDRLAGLAESLAELRGDLSTFIHPTDTAHL
jgi:DNA-binding MarR family transcriptional regulator